MFSLTVLFAFAYISYLVLEEGSPLFKQIYFPFYFLYFPILTYVKTRLFLL